MRDGRRAILNSARKVFSRKGYTGASTREICAEAGITKPALYYHFRSKEHLFRELMIDALGERRKVLLNLAQARGPFRERLVKMVYSDLRSTKEDPAQVRLVFRMLFAPEEQNPDFSFVEEMEGQRGLIASVIQEGVDSGQIRGNADELAGSLIGMQLVAILEYIFAGKSSLTKRRAERCVDLLLRGCGSE
jgi:AcrR family transcriptional regulator